LGVVLSESKNRTVQGRLWVCDALAQLAHALIKEKAKRGAIGNPPVEQGKETKGMGAQYRKKVISVTSRRRSQRDEGQKRPARRVDGLLATRGGQGQWDRGLKGTWEHSPPNPLLMGETKNMTNI